MKTLVMVLMIAGLMSTVGVYAASITGAPAQIGGTGPAAVSAPSTASVTADYTIVGGQVTAVTVGWPPAKTANYTIEVDLGGGFTGTLTAVAGTIAVARTTDDVVTISPAVVTISPARDAEAVTTAEVVILEE